jgi:hypothetical protein
MKKFSLLLLITLISLSCTKDIVEDGFTVYRIEKGQHDSGNRVDVTTRETVAYEVQFTESCLYEIPSDDSLDVNKLFGLSDASSHSNHSARFGWRAKGNQIEIMTYVRRSGNIVTRPIGIVSPGQTACYTINILPDYYLFRFESTIDTIRRTSQFNGMRYHLWPYFGGNNPAPHTMEIYMKRM